MKLIHKEMVSFLPRFPSNVKYNFYLLHIDDLGTIVIYSTFFTHFHCNLLFLSKFSFARLCLSITALSSTAYPFKEKVMK